MTEAEALRRGRSVTALRGLADRYATGIENLAGLLDDERAALSAADVGRIASVARYKEACVMDLEGLERARIEALQLADVGPELEDMSEFLAENADPATVARWQTIFVMAKDCRERNFRNGAAGRVRSEQLKTALSILRGAATDSGTYSALGKESSSQPQRRIGQA